MVIISRDLVKKFYGGIVNIWIKILVIIITALPLAADLSEQEGKVRLDQIHARLTLLHGSLMEEYPEQLMSAMFISENDKVLELGGNVGRNSCVIASLLNDSRNLVVSESDPIVIPALLQNRDYNALFFHVEDAAVSEVPLMQSNWVTIPVIKEVPWGFKRVKTITYRALKQKYGITFNVLVADCEGALFFLFRKDESLLDDVNLVITENDYLDRTHYEEVRARLIAHGFQPAYNRAGGWGPCYNEFYQVWRKN
jgi:hypothetical protein